MMMTMMVMVMTVVVVAAGACGLCCLSFAHVDYVNNQHLHQVVASLICLIVMIDYVSGENHLNISYKKKKKKYFFGNILIMEIFVEFNNKSK